MQYLKSQHIWVLWKLSDGRKRPFSAITGHETGASQDHRHEWTDYNNAASALAKAELKIQAAKAAKATSNADNVGNNDANAGTETTAANTETAATSTVSEPAKTAANTDIIASFKGITCKRGIGFIVPEGHFFLDVDHKGTDDPLVQELMRLLPTYAEVSPSHNGIHFYGKCDLSRLPIMADKKGTRKLSKEYYVKNPNNGLELYIGGLTNRFSTFTGECISQTEDAVDCTDALLRLLDEKMRKYPQLVIDATAAGVGAGFAGGAGSGADDGFDYNNFFRLGKSDIPKIIYDLEHQKNGAKFKSLYRDGEIPDRKTRSEADVTLCALIAFRTGPNPDLIDAIFRQSELMRPKWDREDYAASTIEAGIDACHGNFHPAVRKDANLPPFVIVKKGKAKLDVPRLYNHVRQVLPHILVRDSARTDCSIYVYKGGVYICYGREVLAGAVKDLIEAFDVNLLDVTAIDRTVSLLCKSEKFVSIKDLNKDMRYVNVLNGLYNVRTGQLEAHTPSVYSTIQLPIEYDPAQTSSPLFDSYLDTLCDGVEDKKQFLLEYMGACLSNVPGKKFKKSLFMFGEGDTGKSILKRLTEHLLGEGNYMGIDLKQLEARFGSGSIFGKRLAGSADVSFMKIAELNIFKQATGGDSIQGERKCKDAFEFTYDGLFWFVTNKLPKFGGDDGAWVYKRIIPFHCPNPIPEGLQDKELMEKMLEEEKPAIFNKAMRAFKAVIDNGYNFHEPAETAIIRRNYRVDNNSALDFFDSMMEERESADAVKREEPETVDRIYRTYKSWYSSMNPSTHYMKSRKDFFNDIADFIGVKYNDMKTKGSRGLCLSGYKLTEEAIKKYAPLVN